MQIFIKSQSNARETFRLTCTSFKYQCNMIKFSGSEVFVDGAKLGSLIIMQMAVPHDNCRNAITMVLCIVS